MKGTLAVPFLFLGTAVSAWGSAQPSPAIWSLSLLILCAAWIQSGRAAPGFSPLALAAWAYAGWTVANTVFLSRVYNPAGLFDPVFLLAGFSIGRALERRSIQPAFAWFAASAAALSLWAVGQLALGSARGHALFETPNTLASVLNFTLAPAVVLLASGVRARSLDLLVFLLFAGLCASSSRGAAIALATGVAIGGLFLRKELTWRPMAKVGLLLLAAAALSSGAVAARAWMRTEQAADSLYPPIASVLSRLELYALAWNAATEHLAYGVGYLGFRMILETGRALVPSYGEASITYFVHNDYLQILLELGAPGLLVFILLVALPFILARRRMPVGLEDRRRLAALLAALATTAIHAFGDFPFHVSVCLLLFGLSLGAVDRLLARPEDLARRWRSSRARLAQIVLGAGLVTLLGRPVVAEGAAAYGMHKWQRGEGRAAAFGLELARRFEPRDWRYHLYAGQFWSSEAALGGKPDAARLADEAFAAGVRSNPFDTLNRLGRVFTQIRFAALLAAPASGDTLRQWADEALARAPLNPAVRSAHAEILRQLEARR
jgi:O-antigen ligase